MRTAPALRTVSAVAVLTAACLWPAAVEAAPSAARHPQRISLEVHSDVDFAHASMEVTRERGGHRVKGRIEIGEGSRNCAQLSAVTPRLTTTYGGGTLKKTCRHGVTRFDRWTKQEAVVLKILYPNAFDPESKYVRLTGRS